MSEPKDAPSCRARTWVTTPAVLTGPDPGHVADGEHDVVELQVGALGDRHPEQQRGGVLGAGHQPDGAVGLLLRADHTGGRIDPFAHR